MAKFADKDLQVQFERWRANGFFERDIESNVPLFEAIRKLNVDDWIGVGDVKACFFVADLAGHSKLDLELGARWLAATFSRLPDSRKSDFFEWAADCVFDDCGEDLERLCALSREDDATATLHKSAAERYAVIKRMEAPSAPAAAAKIPPEPTRSGVLSCDIARFFVVKLADGKVDANQHKVQAAIFIADAVWANRCGCLMGSETPRACDDGPVYVDTHEKLQSWRGDVTLPDVLERGVDPTVRDVLDRVAQYLANKSDDEASALCRSQPVWIFSMPMAAISEQTMVGAYTRTTRLVTGVMAEQCT